MWGAKKNTFRSSQKRQESGGIASGYDLFPSLSGPARMFSTFLFVFLFLQFFFALLATVSWGVYSNTQVSHEIEKTAQTFEVFSENVQVELWDMINEFMVLKKETEELAQKGLNASDLGEAVKSRVEFLILYQEFYNEIQFVDFAGNTILLTTRGGDGRGIETSQGILNSAQERDFEEALKLGPEQFKLLRLEPLDIGEGEEAGPPIFIAIAPVYNNDGKTFFGYLKVVIDGNPFAKSIESALESGINGVHIIASDGSWMLYPGGTFSWTAMGEPSEFENAFPEIWQRIKAGNEPVIPFMGGYLVREEFSFSPMAISEEYEGRFPDFLPENQVDIPRVFAFGMVQPPTIAGFLKESPKPAIFMGMGYFLLTLIISYVAAKAITLKREAALGKEAYSRYQALIMNTMAEGLVVIDENSVIQSVNRAAIEIFGYSPGELIGQSVTLLMPKSVRKNHLEGMRRYLETGKGHFENSRTLSIEGLRKDGQKIDLEIAMEDGEHEGKRVFVGSIRDVTERNRAETKARDISERFRMFAEHTSDVIIQRDLDGRILFASPSAARHMGWESEELIGKQSWELIHPEDRKRVEKPWKETLLKKHEPFKSRVRIPHKDGGWVWFDSITEPILDEKGNLVSTVMTSRNVDAQVRAEMAEKETAEKYRILAEYGNDIIFMRNSDGEMLYVSPALKKHLGRDPKDHIGKVATELVYEKDLERVWEDWKETVFDKKKPYRSRVRLKHKDGSLVWMDSVTEPILDERGVVNVCITASRNVTAEVEAEEERLRLGQIIEESPNEVYIYDIKTLKILYANKRACQNLGYTLKELQAKTSSEIKIDYPQKEAKKRLDPLLEGKKNHIKLELQQRRKDGTTYDIDATVHLSKSAEGEVFVCIAEDITKIKRAREETRAAREQYELLANNIHDIVVHRSPDGKILYITPSIEKLLGYKVEDTLNNPTWNFIHPDDREKLQEEWEEHIITKREGFDSLVRTLDSKGKYHWFEARHEPIKNHKGEVTSVVSSTRDVTERVEAEEKIRLLAENTDEIHFLRDIKGKILYITPSLTKHLGYAPEEVMGDETWGYMHPDDAKMVKSQWKKELIAKGKSFSAELRLKQKGKKAYLWFASTTVPVKDKNGKIIRAVTSARNIHVQKMAIEEKEATERRFRMLVDFSNDIITHRDAKGKIIYLSPSVKRHLGYDPEDLKGITVWHLMHPEERKKIEKGWAESVLKKGVTFRSKVRFKHKDGSYVWVDNVTEPVKDDKGKVIYSVTTTRNITEQVEAQEKIKLLAENTDEIIFLRDRKGTLQYITPSMERLTGFSPEEIGEKMAWEFVHPDDRKTIKKLWRESLIKKGAAYDQEIRVKTKKGPYIWYLASTTPIKNKKGQVTGAVTSCRNIHEQKLSAEARAEAERRFRTLVDYSNDIIWHRDEKGRVIYVSPSIKRHLGYDPEALIGKTTWQFIHPEDRKKVEAWKETVLGSGKTFRSKARMRAKNGKYVWLDSVTESVRDKNGKIKFSATTSRNITEQLKAEEERHRFTAIVEETLSEVLILDPEKGTFSYANHAARKNTGYSLAELQTMGPADIAVTRGKKDIDKIVEVIIKGEKQKIYLEGQNRRKDGSIYDVGVTFRRYKGEGGPVVIVIVEDITEKKTAKAEIEEANRRYRMFAESTSDMIIQRNDKGEVLYISPSVENHLGWKPGELVGKNLWHLLEKRNQKKMAKAFLEDIVEKGLSVRLQGRLRHKDGHYVWIEAATEPVKDKNGNIIYAVSSFRNIDEEKKAEELVTRLAAIVENTANEIYVVEPKTLKFRYVNEAGRKNLGYSKEELKNMTPSDIGAKYSAPEDREFYDSLEGAEENKIEIEGRHRRKDGSVYDVALTLQMIKSEGESVYVAIGEDITDKKHAQEQLLQAQKMETVGQLTGGIAHDFNNLLTAILGSLRFLENEKLRPEIRELVEMAVTSTKRGAELTHRLLAFSRKQSLEPQRVRPGALTQGLETLLHRTLGENIKISISVPKEDKPVFADPGELENVLLNLAINARDAMPSGGNLTIEVEPVTFGEKQAERSNVSPGNYVLIRVSDTGVGMSDEIREKVFEPFFTTKGVGEGSGLGLSMVFGFVKQSGGHIEILSAIGKGTAVEIYLPVFSGTNRKKKEGSVLERKRNLEGKIFLVVEDDETELNYLTLSLKAQGAKVVAAQDGEQALKALEDLEAIDLLVVDIVLTDELSGFDVVAAYHKKFPKGKVLYCTGYPEQVFAKRDLPGLYGELLQKPYDLTALLTKVANLVSG